MSIIQTIREKGAKVAVVLIALALLGFIAMDAFSGRSTLFGGSPSNTVGKINGESIAIQDFSNAITQQENYLMSSQGYPAGEATRQMAMESAWNQEINRILMEQEMDKLGIRVTDKELSNSVLFGRNPPQDLKQNFTDPQTGEFNPTLAAQQIREIQKRGTPEQKANINTYMQQQQFMRMTEKYNSLLANTVNVPKWFVEKQNADNSQIARISVVRKTYAEISDSLAKVSDKEIADHISKHKDQFKQEESRSISYVSFSAAPSAADTANAKQRMIALKAEMENTTDIKRFLASEGVQNYYDSYINGKTIQIGAKDSIFKIPAGSIYGPYQDAGTFTIAKLIDARPIPDSVKIRHILISTTQTDQQTGQTTQVRDSATARALIDSVQGLLAAGMPFDTVAARLSEDPGSKNTGGIYETGSGQMVPEFNDFMFTKPVGSKGVVITSFGYHYMEVMSTKGSAMGYKIAYLSKPITASSETDQNALNQASSFVGNSRDEKSFNETFEKELKPKGLTKGLAYDIKSIGSEIQGLGHSRELVRKIYAADKGTVLQPERVGDSYIVAVVTEVLEDGTQSVARARGVVEPLLRNKKKAGLIKKEIGPITTMEAVAAKLGRTVELIDSVRMSGAQPAALGGTEPRVIGAAFNPANRGKIVPEALEGVSGVFVVRVDNVSAVAVAMGSVEEQRKMMYEQAKQRAMYSQPVQALRESANIKDSRSKHF